MMLIRLRKSILAMLVGGLLSGCTDRSAAPQATCVVDALQQSGLRNGVAAFIEHDGTTKTVHASWLGWLRLFINRSYPAASLTKPRLAKVLRQQIDVNRIGLDDPIQSLLPVHAFTGEGVRAITVRHLLQHTAGFGTIGNLDPLWYRGDSTGPNCAEAGRFVLTLPTQREPGVHTEYSNAGYCLLADILLRQEELTPDNDILEPKFRRLLRTEFGGAGGWKAPLPVLHAELFSTLPLERLPSPTEPLTDGSWYSYGWRWWPERQSGSPWTHTGRLPGFLAVALTDGRNQLLVAHFDGDPPDYHAVAQRFGRLAWACFPELSQEGP